MSVLLVSSRSHLKVLPVDGADRNVLLPVGYVLQTKHSFHLLYMSINFRIEYLEEWASVASLIVADVPIMELQDLAVCLTGQNKCLGC